MKKITLICLTFIILSACVQVKERNKVGRVFSIEETGIQCKYWKVTYLYRNIFENEIIFVVASEDLYEKLNQKMLSKEKTSVKYYSNASIQCDKKENINLVFEIDVNPKNDKNVLGNIVEIFSSFFKSIKL